MAQKDPAVVNAEVSDMDYLKSRMTKVLADDDGDDEEDGEDKDRPTGVDDNQDTKVEA